MNPEFPALLECALSTLQAAPVHWHTNGTLLARSVTEIVAASVREHLVYVSIDGGNEATHDANRGLGTFRRSLSGLRRLLEENQANVLRIGLYQLDLGLPASEYDEEFLELAGRCDEWVRVRPLSPTNGTEEHASDFRNSLGSCFWAGNALCIDPNGSVSICLLSHSQSGVIGNLLYEDVYTILDRAWSWREQLQTHGRGSKSHCSSCRKQDGQSHELDILPPTVRSTAATVTTVATP